MRRRNLVIVPLVLLLLVGCAGLKANWDKATPQERTNLVLYGFQKSLGVAVDTGIAYVNAHPGDAKIKTEWQTRIVPAMDGANKILRDLIIKNQAAPLTIPDALNTLTVRMNEIQAMMLAWGVKVQF